MDCWGRMKRPGMSVSSVPETTEDELDMVQGITEMEKVKELDRT